MKILPRIPPVVAQRLAVTGLWTLTAVVLATLGLIILFILWRGLPHVTWGFLTSGPGGIDEEGGILPMIVGTALVAGIGVLVAAPIGVGTAIYLTEYTREGRLTALIRFGADCLAGIPSIIFGMFGFAFFGITLHMGYSILSGALTLALMVLPTIVRTSEEAIRAVPRSYRDVSFGLGSSRWQMVTHVVLRCALPGIATGVVLSLGRAISETAVVMLTSGSSIGMPHSVFDSVRTLALHFYTIAQEFGPTPQAYATAAVLILSVLLINITAYYLMRRFVTRVR